MESLTIEEKISILEEAKTLLLEGTCCCICNALHKAIDRLFPGLKYMRLKQIIPIFLRDNAIQFGASKTYMYWWPIGTWKERIQFIDWMIEELRKLT